MRGVLALVVFGLAVGCGGGGTTQAPGAEKSSAGGGAYPAALKACKALHITVTSSRSDIINGELPEAGPHGKVLVNIVLSGNKVVDIRFYNAPDDPAWKNRWKHRILDAIASAAK